MTFSKEEFQKIQKYCADKGMDIIDFLKNSDQTETPVADPKKIIKKALTDFQKNNDVNVSLDDIARTIESRLENFLLVPVSDYPLKGYLSKLIFNTSQIRKNKSLKPDRYNSIKFPINKKYLNKFSKISFDQESADHILGNLSAPYIKKEYPLNDGLLVDKQGASHRVEGCVSWDGKEKSFVRRELVSFVEEKLFEKFSGDEKKDIESRLKKVEEDISNLHQGQGKVKKVGYQLFGERGAFITLKEIRYFRDLKKVKGLEIKNSTKGKKGHIFRWSDRSSREQTEKIIEELKKDKRIFLKKGISIEEVRERDYSNPNHEKISQLEEERSALEKELFNLEKPLNYLGLEGPNFFSFLEFKKLSDKHGVELGGLVLEYLFRESNIMNSIVKAYPEKFSNVEIMRRNINDAIILDFVRNPLVNLKIGKNDLVLHQGHEVSLNDYYKIINELDNNKNLGEISSKYGIPVDLAEVFKDRYEKKFDLVFLDYYCGDNQKIHKIWKNLPKRLSDESVVAITLNLSKRQNKKYSDTYELLEKQFNEISRIENLEAMDLISHTYRNKKDKMGFVAYHLKRK